MHVRNVRNLNTEDVRRDRSMRRRIDEFNTVSPQQDSLAFITYHLNFRCVLVDWQVNSLQSVAVGLEPTGLPLAGLQLAGSYELFFFSLG